MLNVRLYKHMPSNNFTYKNKAYASSSTVPATRPQ